MYGVHWYIEASGNFAVLIKLPNVSADSSLLHLGKDQDNIQSMEVGKKKHCKFLTKKKGAKEKVKFIKEYEPGGH